MNIDVLKQELAALDESQQRLMTAFLLSLQDSRDNSYRTKLAAKIDQPASNFLTLEEVDERLGLSGDNGSR